MGSALVHGLHACTCDSNSKARAEARRKGMCKLLHVKFADQVGGDHVSGQMKSCILEVFYLRLCGKAFPKSFFPSRVS